MSFGFRLMSVLVVTCLFVTGLTSCSKPGASTPDESVSASSAPFELYNLEHAQVLWVADGDTIMVRLDDGEENYVRLIGIDAPESVNPDESKNTEAGRICSDYLKSFLHEGDDVWLETDVTDCDQYGRWLRYVWMCDPDATDMPFDLGSLNAYLVYYGYAEAKDYPPDTKHSAVLHAQETASIAPDNPVPVGPLK